MLNKVITAITIFLLTGLAVHAQEITFQASVDRNVIATGENVKLTIALQNASGGNITVPDWGGLVVVQGPMQSSSFRRINGRMSRSSSHSWYLTATQPGSYVIGPSSVKLGGGVLHTNPITIKVTKGSGPDNSNAAMDHAQRKDPNLFCTIDLSKNKAYVGEQVIATYTLYYRYNSLRPQDYDLPKLNGFWAEEVDLGNADSRTTRMVNGLRYNVAVLKKQVLIPLHSGKLRVDPMTLNYLVNPGFFSSGTPVRIQSNASVLTVKDLPAGKPADFIGAVGDLRMEVTAGSPTVQANQAIDLSIKFSGRANLKLIDAPQLQLPPDFETYDPKINDRITVNGGGMRGSREFQYLLIPRHAGNYELGKLAFSYFDPSSGTYKQLRSDSISFHVQPGDASGDASVSTPRKSDVQRLGTDIRYIHTGDLGLRPKGQHLFGSWPYLLGMAVPPLLFLLSFMFHRRREQRLGDHEGRRRRGADKVAKQRLAAAAAALEKDDRTGFHDAVGKALEGYFADKFNLGVAEVNETTIREKLSGIDGGTAAEDYISLINEAQMARFAPMENKPKRQVYEEAVGIISRIEHQLRP